MPTLEVFVAGTLLRLAVCLNRDKQTRDTSDAGAPAESDRSIRTMPVGERAQIVLFHTMDPRGLKLGGIETHVRLVLARHPTDRPILLIGIDEIGDLPLGVITPIVYEGRPIGFMPVTRVHADRINKAAKKIGQSTTLRFMMGLLGHLPALRRALRGTSASGEIERFEFAIVPKLVGLPFVLLVHNEGTREDKMDSLLKRYWFLHLANERIALTFAKSIFAVNESIARRIDHLSSGLTSKTAVMSVSVDTERFSPTPFPADDDAFHVCFAGRLDDFKDPPLMFATLACLQKSLASKRIGRFRRVVFDYIGASDPGKISEFASIAELTVRHGSQRASEVASIVRHAHVGIITSFFEGMPCYLLEMLASGRPVAAIALPQFLPVVLPGRTGALVDRQTTQGASAEALTTALRGLAEAIVADQLDPNAIASVVQPFSVSNQMTRLFASHDAIARSFPR